ncbi:MAG: dTDP-glucose 4,6-dehydratase [Anaerolineales bacterium]|jgi:dTDP-glucose 4,6-dehydratase
MQNLLVTGGAGFIGCNFIRFVLRNQPAVRIVNLDALTYAGNPANLRDLPDPERHVFVHGDICDQNLVVDLLRQYEIDAIVHFAAESHVDRSILGPALFVHTNIEGTFSLLEAARAVWGTTLGGSSFHVRFHHISTDEVYGSLGPGDPPFTETTRYAPNSPYAASKAASDHLVRAYGRSYRLPILITNCSNNFGPYQFPEKLIPLMILSAREGKPLPVYGDGGQIRDWLYVEDHCEALWTVLQHGLVGETYHIGGNTQPTNLNVIRQICAILDRLLPSSRHRPYESLIQFVADRPGHDRRYAMDTTKIRRELGWQARHSFVEGLENTVKWYLENGGWLSAIHEQEEYQAWLKANYGSRRPMAG